MLKTMTATYRWLRLEGRSCRGCCRSAKFFVFGVCSGSRSPSRRRAPGPSPAAAAAAERCLPRSDSRPSPRAFSNSSGHPESG